MKKKLVTIAIHKLEKATIAKNLLEQREIPVVLEEITQELPHGKMSLGYDIQVPEQYVNMALTIISNSKLLSYTDAGIFQHDDGRNRILVAVDFSEYSLKACKTAFDFAKGLDAKVKILNVFNNMRYPLHMPFADIVRGPEDDSILAKARRNMLNLCQEIDDRIAKGEMPSVNYSFSLREGIVEEEIENYVEEYQPALLVLGTKGLSNNTKNIIGNVTADIIETTNVPVAAVPLKSRVENIKDIGHIGYLTNVDKRDLESFDNLVKNAHFYTNVKITLIHVNVTPKGKRFNEQQLADMQEYFQLRYPSINIGYKLINTENSNDMMDALEEFIIKEEVGMICLNTRKRNILGRIFMPSLSRKLLKNIEIHLMVLRDPK